MAEFLLRGYNVAIPEVDVGDDLFVVRDADGDLARVQVKTAMARGRATRSYAATFNLRFSQLAAPTEPELHYVFVVRDEAAWRDFVLIPRAELYAEHENHRLGTRNGERLIVALSATETDLVSSRRSLQRFRNAWTRWPLIRH